MNVRKVSRLLSIVALVAGACFESGCASYHLRPGIWELSYNVERSQNHREFPLDPREVRLDIEANDRGDGEIVQMTDVVPVEGLEPMYGDIRRDGEEKWRLYIDCRDDFFHMRMSGEVRDPEHVAGEMLFASHRQIEDLTFEGRWALRWVRDG